MASLLRRMTNKKPQKNHSSPSFLADDDNLEGGMKTPDTGNTKAIYRQSL